MSHFEHQNGLDLQSFAVGFDAGLNFLSPLAQTEFLALVYFLISDFLKSGSLRQLCRLNSQSISFFPSAWKAKVYFVSFFKFFLAFSKPNSSLNFLEFSKHDFQKIQNSENSTFQEILIFNRL